MRFLFTFTGGHGHFLPTLPIARAVLARGHQVRYACQDAMIHPVEKAGLTAHDGGGHTLPDPDARWPLTPVDRAADERVIRTGFAEYVPRQRIPRLLDIAGSWRPDVVVRDEMDFGAAVAAEILGVPHAAVTVIAAGGLVRPDLLGEPLSALRTEYGLDPDPGFAMVHRYLTLVPVPPSYRDPRDPLPATAFHLRPAVLDDRPCPRPGSGRPVVYFTLGTVFHQLAGDLFTRVLAGLRELPVDVIVTTGHEIDPAELGEQPPNVHIERFRPLADVLAGCDAVVSHGGSGSVIGALAFGLPSVLLPIGADQPLNADRCAALGVAEVLDAPTSTPRRIADAVTAVLTDPARRTAAARLRDEIAALPGADEAAVRLERLAHQ